jgi:uncharacterized protein YciI
MFIAALLLGPTGQARAAEDEAPASLFVGILHNHAHDPGAEIGEAEGASLLAHVTYLNSLYDQGVLYLAGPFMDESSEGLCILSADSLEAARGLLEADPSVQAGLMEIIGVHPLWDAFNAPEERRFTVEQFQAMTQEPQDADAAAEAQH